MTVGPAPPYAEAWTFAFPPVAEQGLSAPVIAGDVAVTVGPKAVYGLDLQTGGQVWSVPRDGPPAPPAIVQTGGRSLVLFTDGATSATSTLRAIDLATMKDAWKSSPSLKAVSRTGVTVEASTAYVGDADGNVYAVDVGDGTPTWAPVDVGGEPKGPLAVAGGRVFAVPLGHESTERVDASVVALDAATGERSWQQPVTPTTIYASLPVAISDEVIVVAPGAVLGEGVVSARRPADGSEVWRSRVSAFLSPLSTPAVGPDAVYAADFQGGLHAISRTTHEQLWQYQFAARIIRASPILVGDHVLIGVSDGSLAAVDATSGHLVWQSAPRYGVLQALAAGPDIILAVQAGKHGGLVAFRTDPTGSSIDRRSPTVPVLGTILGRWAIASAVVGAVVVVPLTLLVRRLGPLTIADDDDADDDDADDDEDPS